jgi:hypothetical protein
MTPQRTNSVPGGASPIVFAIAQTINEQQCQSVREVEHVASTSGIPGPR